MKYFLRFPLSMSLFEWMDFRYVKTSDGTRHDFKAGDVLFQDNTKDSPAQNQPQHYSGVVGNKPCQQLIVQLSRTPEVNNPDPFK